MDLIAVPGNEPTDIVCNLEHERWPLADNSVSHVFSSHCFEHFQPSSLVHICKEISRVAADGCELEIWAPYAFHRDATILGHVNYLTEEIYYHFCTLHQAAWSKTFEATWFLQEIRYHCDPGVIASLKQVGIDADLAINHFNNIVQELGIFIKIDKTGSLSDPWNFKRVMVDENTAYGGDLRSTRNLNPKLLSVGPYRPILKD